MREVTRVREKDGGSSHHMVDVALLRPGLFHSDQREAKTHDWSPKVRGESSS